MWRALVGWGQLGSGCLVLRANTRENPGGKNGVMTVAPSLFGVSWHKECRIKNKWLDFCPLGFSRFSCLSPGTAKNLPQFVCHSLLDGLFLNRLTHGSKVKVGFRFLVFSQNSTFPSSAFSFPASSDLVLRKSVRPFEVRRHVRSFGGGRNFEKYGLNLRFTQT